MATTTTATTSTSAGPSSSASLPSALPSRWAPIPPPSAFSSSNLTGSAVAAPPMPGPGVRLLAPEVMKLSEACQKDLSDKSAALLDDFVRLERLIVKGSESREEVMKAIKALATSEARIVATETTLNQIQAHLNETKLSADRSLKSLDEINTVCDLLL